VTTPAPGLDRIAEAFRDAPAAQLRGGLSLELILGRLADHFDWTRKQAQRAGQAAAMFPFPAQVYTITGGAPGVPTFVADAIAPKDGYVWFATRLSVDGLVPGTGNNVFQEANVAAPGAGVTVLNIAAGSIAAGAYYAYVTVGLNGPVAAADANNMQISGPGTGGNRGLVVPAVVGSYPQDVFILNVPAGNGTALKVSAIGAATAATTYSAEISLVPLSSDAVQLYRGPALAIAAQPQNRIHTFTAAGSPGNGPDWTPGGRGLLMSHQDALTLAGSGLAAAQLVLSGDVICLEAAHVPRYIAGIG
jgi:hypothetical protein